MAACIYRPALALVLGLGCLNLAAPARAQQVSGRPEASKPGALISADPVAAPPEGMQAWRITYWTTLDHGAPVRATGMVIAPGEAPAPRGRPVIAWQHGAWGVASKCAPSLSGKFFEATPALADMVRRGYVVAAADYPGLGSKGVHGFLAGRETAHSVLDAVRAARAIPGTGASSRLALWGESQGGHATLWTAAEARAYAPDLTLVGAAAAAPPTDLLVNLAYKGNPAVKAMFTAFVTYSWSRRYGAPLADVFGPRNRGVVTRLAQNNCVQLDTKPKLGTILGVMSVQSGLKGKDLGTIEPWARLARTNSVDASKVPGPVLIAQSVADPLVSPDATRDFARRLCARGRAVRYIAIPGGDHAASARNSAAETLDWIDARFAGGRPGNDCRKI